MKKLFLTSIILSTSFNVIMVRAADLKPPFTFNNAKVLPVGVRNLSYKGAMIDGNDKYSNEGSSVALANPLIKDITFQELIDGKMDPTEKGALQQAMYSIGANPEDTFGQTQGQVNVEAMAHVAVFAWGLTPKITVGTVIPTLQSSVNVKVGMVQQNSALYQSMIAALQDKGADIKSAEFISKMANPINAKAAEYNYKPIENENKTELGDMRLLAKFQALDKEESRLTFQADITLPTGKPLDKDKLVSIASGDGQTDVGFSAYYDYSFNEPTILSISTGYTAQLKDSLALRVPERESSKITPDTDYKVSRDLGDLVFFQTNITYTNNYTLSAGYTFQYKEEDSFSGKTYEPERYKWLSKDTRQNMQSLLLSVGYETVTAFKAKRFPAPLTISLNHARILTGKNVVKDPLTSLDFSLFF